MKKKDLGTVFKIIYLSVRKFIGSLTFTTSFNIIYVGKSDLVYI